MLRATALALAMVGVALGADEEGVVVLRSGGVLPGKVSVSGERYVVTQLKSVVDVPAPQVLLVAKSMDDAYQRQRQQLPHETAEAHLGLAEWCLRYNLLEPARQELSDAQRLDPRDPRVALLGRRLNVASQVKKPHAAQVATKPHDDNPAKEELRKLDSMVKDLPPGVVERFTRKIQPLVVNNCTTSGCHQATGQQKFQLDRAVLYGLSNRRITLRNLVATLELVDRTTPDESELLTIPRHVHGGMDRPILGTRQETQLTQLIEWVGLVTETSVASEPIAAQSEFGALPIQPPEPPGLRTKPSHHVDHNVVPANFKEGESLLPKSELQFGAKLKTWAPKDEFDPEIFNRNKPEPIQPPATTAVGPPATH